MEFWILENFEYFYYYEWYPSFIIFNMHHTVLFLDNESSLRTSHRWETLGQLLLEQVGALLRDRHRVVVVTGVQGVYSPKTGIIVVILLVIFFGEKGMKKKGKNRGEIWKRKKKRTRPKFGFWPVRFKRAENRLERILITPFSVTSKFYIFYHFFMV